MNRQSCCARMDVLNRQFWGQFRDLSCCNGSSLFSASFQIVASIVLLNERPDGLGNIFISWLLVFYYQLRHNTNVSYKNLISDTFPLHPC